MQSLVDTADSGAVRRAFDEPRYTVTFMADPTHPRDYAFAAGLSREQWAWEFLRRSPDYRREWAAFDATSDDLISTSGASLQSPLKNLDESM